MLASVMHLEMVRECWGVRELGALAMVQRLVHILCERERLAVTRCAAKCGEVWMFMSLRYAVAVVNQRGDIFPSRKAVQPKDVWAVYSRMVRRSICVLREWEGAGGRLRIT